MDHFLPAEAAPPIRRSQRGLDVCSVSAIGYRVQQNRTAAPKSNSSSKNAAAEHQAVPIIPVNARKL
jgi:hypothetical protein